MKILWLSSVQLSDTKVLGSGTWIPGMLSILKEHYPDLEIVNITKGKVKSPEKKVLDLIAEWIIPSTTKMSAKTINYISGIIREENPDVIQVWGTEDFWGTFPFKEYFPNIPAILEIQGILRYVSEEYYGGLTPGELLRCWNIKEFLKPSSSLPAIRRSYTKNIDRETFILKSFDNIGVQSQWSADVIKTYNSQARLFNSGIALREPFYSSKKWAPNNDGEIRIFSTALMGQPLKGSYTLFRAFNIVHQFFSNAKLILAGAQEHGIRQSGLCRMLKKYAQKNGFIDSIRHNGACTAQQLAELYRTSSVFVNPSNWESYSVVTAEAMYIGCPTVAAYSGAMPELGRDSTVLYFPKNDYRICAMEILKILNNSDFAKELSNRAINVAEGRQDKTAIAKNQMNVYRELINRK